MTWRALRDSAFILLLPASSPDPLPFCFSDGDAWPHLLEASETKRCTESITDPESRTKCAQTQSEIAPSAHQFSIYSSPRSGTNSDESDASSCCSASTWGTFSSPKKMPFWGRSALATGVRGSGAGVRSGGKAAPATCRR